jgi:hypothetical protein
MNVILVTQRDEVGFLGKKNYDSSYVESFLKSNSISYKWCHLTSNDFMPIDGHPNKNGYKKLFSCLKKTIFEMK